MILVDSSVWIDYFNGRRTAQTNTLERFARTRLLTGDLIMAEVLQGFAAEADFHFAQRIFAALEFRPMVGREIALAAAGNYRALRARGVTLRGTIDTLISRHSASPKAMNFFIATATSILSSGTWDCAW